MDLTVEDFQRVLFELYLTQRENNALRAELARLRRERVADPAAADTVVDVPSGVGSTAG